MASQDSTKKHKRKSTAVTEEAGPSDLRVILSDPSSSVGPVFVNFPSVRPSKSTPFTLYTRDPGSNVELAKQHTLVASETEDVEFFSTNRDRNAGTEGKDCQYLPAIYNPDAGTLHIHTSTPLYLIGHRVKRLRTAALTTTSRAIDYRAKRNDLGEVFGTRKAKSQIRAEERNKVNVGSMQGVKGHLMEAIGEQMDIDVGVAAPSELIPPPNVSTPEAALVYPRESLIPDVEWSAIDATSLFKSQDDRTRAGLLPWRRSRFVENKMRMAVEGSMPSSAKKTVFRMGYYLCALLAFNDISGSLSKMTSSEISSKLPGVPPQIVNGLVSRFSEATGKKRAVSEKMKTKLLAWICVAYLHLDNFSVDVGKVAKELNLQPNKVVDMYKSLGCKVDLASPAEREKLGLSMAEVRANRRAVLKAPVVFPKPRTRAPPRR